MELLRLDGPLDETLVDPVLVTALDGWTDAGRAGSSAADLLASQWHGHRVGSFSSDALFDYRDRRPLLTIDRGLLGDPVWPALELTQLTAPRGTRVVLLHGGEPDFAWQQLGDELAELTEMLGVKRYYGLGAVPGPVPHTRSTSIVTTGSNEEALERIGRPHERLTVPASCQVAIEARLRDHGVETLGLWARIPHYVAGEYPAATRALLESLRRELDEELDLRELSDEADEHRTRLDEAASSSSEIQAHIHSLEIAYDEEIAGGRLRGPLPTGDEIAAEFERFLRGRDEGGDGEPR